MRGRDLDVGGVDQVAATGGIASSEHIDGVMREAGETRVQFSSPSVSRPSVDALLCDEPGQVPESVHTDATSTP